ncbi:hypothetical protein QAD02_013149 [Eretmocerus hayati]|uniref:Uncharacterized protein n=1 Tax=Eretmocerus hayati TaxID=131215 RepID=A0ACC2P1V6_9HYME|nr:hypothetical protein QAD02_013149 [Eretmocerus hayati]
MLDSMNIGSLTKNSQMELNEYQDCSQRIVCPNPSPKCFLLDCLNCSNTRPMRNFLLDKFEENDMSVIRFETWTHTERCSIVTESLNTHNFLDLLCERLMKSKTHDFSARQKSAFVKELKINLQPGQFIVGFDFAENYAFVVQNSAQSFHWNNNQATIFTVVINYVGNGELKHRSQAIISDNLAHDTYSGYQYQKIIIEYLKKNFELVTKIFYVTDGASQHFNNKSNFARLHISLHMREISGL